MLACHPGSFPAHRARRGNHNAESHPWNHRDFVIWGRGEASALPTHVPKELPKTDASPLQRGRPNGTQPGSFPAIVQNFKSISTRKMNATRGAPGSPLWQRGFYEHVVRNEAELTAIRQYVMVNPARWDDDENNPALITR